jgi:hypothetical protein
MDKKPLYVLNRIKRGLVGYVSYLAACEMNEAFSEYVLYEPTLRILSAMGFTTKCEYSYPGQPQSNGDKKRIDFLAIGHGLKIALETKWAKKRKPRIVNDIRKLRKCKENDGEVRTFLCVFGVKSVIEHLELHEKQAFKEFGTAIYADLRITKYGCKIFELDKCPRSL